jgi:hypothetical protein
MHRFVKQILGLIGIALCVVLLWAAHFHRNLRIGKEKRSIFQAQLEAYQRDVPVGTPRIEVKSFLNNRKTSYADGRDILVKLGEMPGDGFACDRWMVSAKFEFAHASARSPGPQDALTAISLQEIGHCL